MEDAGGPPIGIEDVRAAAARLAGVARRTPVMTSGTFDGMVGAACVFKCENFQRVGAFKFRGAYHALSSLSDDEKARGVVTFSSGNHAQAVALAGRLLGIRRVIVMPRSAPRVKLAATRGYGAEVVEHEPSETAREAVAEEIAQREGLVVIPPFDHPHIAAGQGTAALELIEDAGPLDALVAPVGGGGLISGCAVAAKALNPACRVIGVEPEAGDDGVRSFREKRLVTIEAPETIADGARTPSLGPRVTLPTILALVDEMVTVPDAALVRAMRFLWGRMKLVVEPTGALATAALMEGVVSAPGERVGVIISGGNVDLARCGEWFG